MKALNKPNTLSKKPVDATASRASASTLSHAEELETNLRATGARVTGPRLAVMDVLTRAGRALTHKDVERALEGRSIDRVTMYRVLDWLAHEGLAHKIADDDRVYRFSAGGTPGDDHAHFKCTQCGDMFCVPGSAAPKLKLPKGFAKAHIDLTVRGTCADCAAPARAR